MVKRSSPPSPPLWPVVRTFLYDIKEHPDDDVPRLVFADWLEEHDDPRGELMRVQCELARLPEDDPRCKALRRREEQLLARHETQWLGPLRRPLQDWDFRRGLLHVTVRATQASRLMTLLRDEEVVAWVEGLAGWGVGHVVMQRLAEQPALAQLTRLKLIVPSARWQETAGVVSVLTRSPYLTRLVALDLSANRLWDEAAQILASSACLCRLTHLDLSRNRIGNAGARALASSRHLRQLAVLDLRGNEVEEKAALALRRRFGERVKL